MTALVVVGKRSAESRKLAAAMSVEHQQTIRKALDVSFLPSGPHGDVAKLVGHFLAQQEKSPWIKEKPETAITGLLNCLWR